MNPYRNLSSEALHAMAKLLHSYFKPINYQYSELTKEEQALVTEEEFNALVAWLKASEDAGQSTSQADR